MRKRIKYISLFCMLILVLGGCRRAPAPTPTPSKSAPVQTQGIPTSSPPSVTPDMVKTGMAVITSIAKSTDAGANPGLAEVDSTVVAALFDKEGKILACKIDGVQTKINFAADGKLTTPLDTKVQSKQELGSAYGLGQASGIKKEWNEQANAFANYVKGKTVDEVKGIAVNAEGVPTQAELTSSVTIHVGDFISGIEKAYNNARALGAKPDDKLGLGVATTIDKSKDAGDTDGDAQAYSKYAAVTFDANNIITSCVLDASQSDVNFSKAGKITSDKSKAPQTKTELGDAYGLKKASPIGKEWYQQAQAFSSYVVGKTFDEVKGFKLKSEGAPDIAELTSSVTISVAEYIDVIEKAAASAK